MNKSSHYPSLSDEVQTLKAFCQKVFHALTIITLLALPAGAESTSFVSKSLIEKTVTAPNGAVTVQDALNVNKLLGAHEKVVDELTEGVYHISGWGIAHTIAIDAREGWIIVDTGDTTKTAAEMRIWREMPFRRNRLTSRLLPDNGPASMEAIPFVSRTSCPTARRM